MPTILRRLHHSGVTPLESMAQEAAIMELQKRGITLISVQEPDLMSDDPSRKAFRQMMGVFAEYDKSQIVLKLRVARERKKAQTGRCEGRKPYAITKASRRSLDV